jgi:hypothetical protein
VDFRSEVREMALAVLREATPAKAMSAEEARALIGDLFGALMVCMLEWFQKDGAPAVAESGAVGPPRDFEMLGKAQARVVELERQLEEQKQQSHHERALRRKTEEQRQQLQKLDNDLRQAGRELEKERQLRDAIKAQLAGLREQQAALEKALADQVRSGVEQGLNDLRNRWLKRPLEVEREAARLTGAAPEAGDALQRAADALRRQAETDRLAGTLSGLRQRFGELADMERRVQTARGEALHPLPALETAERELAGEIARLRALLREPPRDGSAVVARLMGRINAAPSGDDVMRVQKLLADLGDAEALDAGDLQRLYRRCHDRLARLYAAFTPRVVKKDVRLEDPVWRLKNAVEEDENLVVLVDGHNVAFALTGLLGDAYEENGEPGTRARERLMELVLTAFGRSPKCRVEVFFDGPDAARKRRAENVFEVYSGGQGEHRADRALTEQIEFFCRTMSAMPRILVTDDKDLREAARGRDTRIMPAPQFGAFLEEMLE